MIKSKSSSDKNLPGHKYITIYPISRAQKIAPKTVLTLPVTKNSEKKRTVL